MHTHDTHQTAAPIVFNGYQLLDALNAIAPDRTPQQLQHRVCIGRAPLCTTAPGGTVDLHCWLADYPDGGSIQLATDKQSDGREPCDVVGIAMKLIEAARWVCKTEGQRKPADARTLALAVLKLTRPIIDNHVDGNKKPA